MLSPSLLISEDCCRDMVERDESFIGRVHRQPSSSGLVCIWI